MEIVGIICEYNPFHNGHLYHINKIKEMFTDPLIVLVMSSHYTQRGDLSILNKWDKTEIALNNGVDLVIELPFEFSTQSSDIFAKGAIEILKALKAEYLVFGSESNDIVKLNNLASIQNTVEYNYEVSKLMKKGISFPSASSKALHHLHGEEVDTPNDILGLSYIKERFEECLACPITNGIFINPVITPEGQTFDHLFISKGYTLPIALYPFSKAKRTASGNEQAAVVLPLFGLP